MEISMLVWLTLIGMPFFVCAMVHLRPEWTTAEEEATKSRRRAKLLRRIWIAIISILLIVMFIQFIQLAN